MKIEVLQDAEAVARRGAAIIAEAARAAVGARGQFILGVSGGQTPGMMLRSLTSEDVTWDMTHVVQVDERIAPATHPDRNLLSLRECLRPAPLRPEQIHAMPVDEPDLRAAAGKYAELLQTLAGSPAVLDLIHLGLGADGHTASLVPGDPVLDVTDTDVSVTAEYRGRRRMTLTYPLLNRARRILWIVTGSEKAEALARLRGGDTSIPAGRVQRVQAIIVADESAAGGTITR